MDCYQETIISDLHRLGVRKNSALLVHSSLRSLGNFPNKPEIVIDALKQALGDLGTLLMPSLSYETVGKDNPTFDVRNSPSCVGGLTEYFRQRPEVKRSIMPTHSVCGIGYEAETLLDEHHKDTTPCGEHSPYRKLKEINGQILFMGCGMNPNTSMHAIEELVKPPYLFGDYVDYEVILADGSTITMKLRSHNFKGYEQRYDRIEDVLDPRHLHKGKILNANCYLVEVQAMWDIAHKMLLKDSLYFVNKTNQ